MKQTLNLGLVASGSGTDANSIMEAYCRQVLLPEVKLCCLLSTKPNAGCLDKAAAHGIMAETIVRHGLIVGALRERAKTQFDFEAEVKEWIARYCLDMIFLVGCIHTVPINNRGVSGRPVAMFNIHPARTFEHGGLGMYGLPVHEHVLSEIVDRLRRHHARLTDTFYTEPTVHRVIDGYDWGDALMSVKVPIPVDIIEEAQTDLTHAAERLQQVVLPFEWLMLPPAVNMAARLYLDNREPSAMIG
ncbi:MAG: formyltransferase family protein [Candidatus Buchananbacteria bacterium]